jgi:diguanylate cyclase (GGDEF)-like protein
MKTAVLISRDTVLIAITERILQGYCRIVPFANIRSALDYVYSIVPNLLVIDMPLDDSEIVDTINRLKGDPIFTHLPVLAVVDDRARLPEWDSVLIEDYVWKSRIDKDLADRARLSILRSERVVEVNPLTRLPGNISINRTIQDLIDRGEIFAIGYGDLDNFKPFNDHYGFSRGDEVIKMTGRLILNVVKSRQPTGSFVGHIGGDDFVFLMDADLVEVTAAEIVETFDRIISTFYDPPEREAGSIISTDRQGNPRPFSIMTISIGVTSNKKRRFSHYGEITEAVSEMKRYAKHSKGSCYRTDKRKASSHGKE